MEIPYLPTDNLYKFFAIFGLTLVVFSSYMVNQTPENLFSEVDRLRVKEQLLKLNYLNDTTKVSRLGHLKDSLEYIARVQGLSRKVERFPKLIYLYYFLFILGAASTSIGFVRWYVKTQKYNDRILENKSNDKSIIVYQMQFEKEFEVYNQLWPKLLSLRNATQNLRPKLETIDKSEPEELRKNRKIASFNICFNDCLEIFDHNKPFYPEDIYKEIAKVLKTSQLEAIEFEYMQITESEYFKSALKNMDEIITKIDLVCLKIRDRIGILRVK